MQWNIFRYKYLCQLLVLSFLSVTGLYSQPEIGIYYSPNLAFMIESDSEGHHNYPIFGNQLGLSFGYKHSPRLTIKTGSSFTTKGVNQVEKFENDTLSIKSSAKLIHRYIGFPVTVRYSGIRETKLNWYIESGMVYNLYLNEHGIYDGVNWMTGEDLYFTYTESRRSRYNRLNLSIIVNPGILYRLNDKFTLVSSVYSEWMITELYNKKLYDWIQDRTGLHNLGIRIELVYQF